LTLTDCAIHQGCYSVIGPHVSPVSELPPPGFYSRAFYACPVRVRSA
jgi:hypothetical protein